MAYGIPDPPTNGETSLIKSKNALLLSAARNITQSREAQSTEARSAYALLAQTEIALYHELKGFILFDEMVSILK